MSHGSRSHPAESTLSSLIRTLVSRNSSVDRGVLPRRRRAAEADAHAIGSNTAGDSQFAQVLAPRSRLHAHDARRSPARRRVIQSHAGLLPAAMPGTRGCAIPLGLSDRAGYHGDGPNPDHDKHRHEVIKVLDASHNAENHDGGELTSNNEPPDELPTLHVEVRAVWVRGGPKIIRGRGGGLRGACATPDNMGTTF